MLCSLLPLSSYTHSYKQHFLPLNLPIAGLWWATTIHIVTFCHLYQYLNTNCWLVFKCPFCTIWKNSELFSWNGADPKWCSTRAVRAGQGAVQGWFNVKCCPRLPQVSFSWLWPQHKIKIATTTQYPPTPTNISGFQVLFPSIPHNVP